MSEGNCSSYDLSLVPWCKWSLCSSRMFCSRERQSHHSFRTGYWSHHQRSSSPVRKHLELTTSQHCVTSQNS